MDSFSTRGIWWNLDDAPRNSIHWLRFWPGDRVITVTTTAGPPRMIASWMRPGHAAVLEGGAAPEADGWCGAPMQSRAGAAVSAFRFRADGAELISEEARAGKTERHRYVFVPLDDAALDTPPAVRAFKPVTARSLLKAGLTQDEIGAIPKPLLKRLSYLTLAEMAQQIDPDLAKRIASFRDAFAY